jgi:hypothetical protein
MIIQSFAYVKKRNKGKTTCQQIHVFKKLSNQWFLIQFYTFILFQPPNLVNIMPIQIKITLSFHLVQLLQ